MKNKSLSCIPCFSWFHFPENCCVNQRIGKVLFAENGPLTPGDRRAFKSDIAEINCSYVLDENHGILLHAYTDEEHEYSSLVQIDVVLKKPGKAARIAELCHRTMPYPLIVILHDGENLCLSMAEKRFSRDGKEQLVLERTVHTPWLAEIRLKTFLQEADFAKFHKTSFRDLYFYYMNLLEALTCFSITGKWQTGGVDPEIRRKALEEIHRLDQEIATVKSRVKNESELSVLVEWNIAVKNLEQRRREVVQLLKGES